MKAQYPLSVMMLWQTVKSKSLQPTVNRLQPVLTVLIFRHLKKVFTLLPLKETVLKLQDNKVVPDTYLL